ncbi:hypothetical protein AA13595_2926 [Gluconacetobacter johannae DSM 13595]|uniref:Uncharacterized protein n=1 Tax=Gluconacetobacter johannae TaxID=112140 RepID=A0A7W4J7U6_9PROT|nr:hypothetical protein [Gluconacetobacter johannae]MBB2176287.1 hypothetical protein [Gluconacetobacter johannae]GBQ90575.1 hypothetical protein AA13595_2926 [Gluconacetobacter johannae DSM 13595]
MELNPNIKTAWAVLILVWQWKWFSVIIALFFGILGVFLLAKKSPNNVSHLWKGEFIRWAIASFVAISLIIGIYGFLAYDPQKQKEPVKEEENFNFN